ncbi:MAG: bifunctional homocysteine S-methyltransferase/methylenetetrahydrofolate reductase, partial [Candidatus Sumerlaeia bacterium]|nr:bifunctional homocysteine S-methyltransferase/methylenetetrahydrofolate reductase [Candidatus Sumerlaeia bacterium]
AYIAGVVGPPGEEVEGDLEKVSRERLREVYTEQVSALLEGGVDAIFIETFSHLPTLAIVAELVRELAPDLPIAAMVQVETNGETRFGQGALEIAKDLDALPANLVGLSDGPGPAVLNKVLDVIHQHTAKPLALMPGAGFPLRHEDRYLNMATPEYFMELIRQGMHKGARLVGGSSGCHPEHIKAISGSIKMLQPTAQPIAAREVPNESREVSMVEVNTPSRFQEKLRAGRFVVSIEIDPPVGTDATASLDAAEKCAQSGLVDAINIADGPRATARMGPIDMAILLRERVRDVEPIVHFCCRDRNILGMQADLIGANALGIHNILMITGDPPKLGDYPFATAVYDVDAIGALKIAGNLNSGNDLAGNPLRGPATGLFLGAGANPGAIDLSLEIARLEAKVEAGACYILTQPVYDPDLYFKFRDRISHIKVPILLGILPLASYRNAEFLTKEVPGMHVPDPIRERLRQCSDKESARQCGIEIARDSLREALPTIQGTYIMPPFNRVDSALAVLEVAKDRILEK